MSKVINISGFKGMTNLKRSPSVFLDDAKMCSPHLILNANIHDNGVLTRRGGYRQVVSLSGCHSLWSGAAMLCVANGITSPVSLYRVGPHGQAVELCAVPGPREPLSYVEEKGKVYISNRYWRGIYDMQTETVVQWGLPLPTTPSVGLATGNLTSGKYSLCYTPFEGERTGGNGHILTVTLNGDGYGLELLNFPDNYLCWITHPNGGQFFLARLDGNVIREPVPYLQPLNTFGVLPPPHMVSLASAFGRIWGARGRIVHYSDPFQPEWFRIENFVPFPEEIIMIAPVHDGLFVSSLDSTWFLQGGDPAKMVIKRVGEGAVPGTLATVQVEGGGYEISRKLSQLPTPMWASRGGVVVGTHNGHLVHLTKSRLRVALAPAGASVFGTVDGLPRAIVTLRRVSRQDPDVAQAMQDGRLITR